MKPIACKFCGNEPELKWSPAIGHYVDCAYVTCSQSPREYGDTQSEAISNWNREMASTTLGSEQK